MGERNKETGRDRGGRLFLILCTMIMLAGCAAPKEQKDPGGSQPEVPEATPAPVPLPSDYVTEEMYERAVAFREGDLTRLAAVMRRARAGEDITVGVIGGSITEGYSASNRAETSYACHMRNLSLIHI